MDIKKPLRLDSKGYFTPVEYFDNNAEEIYDKYLDGDYDGIIIENSDKSLDDSVIYLVDNPTRIKSANDNIGTFDGKNPDIRYSREMDTVKALERQKKLLQEQRDFWKDQTRLTKTAKADKDAVRKLGREILREYSSSTKVEDILTDLQWLADDAVSQGGASYNELTEAAEQIARKVLEGSGVDVNGDMAEARKELKQYLRSTPINITESIKAGIHDFSDFKKRNRGLRFREDGSGTDVDAMWLELQDQFGTGMFPEDVSNPGNQVRYIAEKVASISEDIQNPYRKDMEFAVQQLTYDILFQTTMVEKKKPTMADKRKERETRAKESVNQEVEKATQELRELVEKGHKAREGQLKTDLYKICR